jgi:hypothetical protein
VNPLRVSRQIEASYRSYLRSTFAPRREAWRSAFEEALGSPDRPLTRGPFLQATPPFEPGATLADLVTDGTLSEGFRRIPQAVFPADRPLHWHQEQAIRRALAGRGMWHVRRVSRRTHPANELRGVRQPRYAPRWHP